MRKKTILWRVVVTLALIAVVDMSVISALGKDPMDGLPGGETLRYLEAVLGEYDTGLAAGEESRLAGLIVNESSAYGVDPLLVMALIKTESTFYNYSRSYKGAVGLMQILPSTGRMVAEELELEWEGDSTLFNPYANVRLGIHYLSALSRRYGNDTMMTLAAYNAGPANVSSFMKRSGRPPGVYAGKVMKNYAGLMQEFQERVVFN